MKLMTLCAALFFSVSSFATATLLEANCKGTWGRGTPTAGEKIILNAYVDEARYCAHDGNKPHAAVLIFKALSINAHDDVVIGEVSTDEANLTTLSIKGPEGVVFATLTYTAQAPGKGPATFVMEEAQVVLDCKFPEYQIGCK